MTARIASEGFTTKFERTATAVLRSLRETSRIQWFRAAVAVVGAAVGAIGFSVAYVQGGGWDTGFHTSFTLPLLVGTALGLTAVWLPKQGRYKAVRIVLYFMILLAVSYPVADEFKLKLVSGLICGLASLAIVSIGRSGRMIAASLARFRRPIPGVAAAFLATIVIAIVVLARATTAGAQADGPTDCSASNVSATVNGETLDFADAVRTGKTLVIELSEKHEELDLSASSNVSDAMVKVEMTGTEPLPLVSSPALIWWDELNDGTASTTIDIVRGSLSEPYSVELGAQSRTIPILFGSGTFLATFSPRDGGAPCVLQVEVRIVAEPLDTPVGLVAVAAMLLGGGALGAVLLTGRDPRPRRSTSVQQSTEPKHEALEPLQHIWVDPLQLELDAVQNDGSLLPCSLDALAQGTAYKLLLRMGLGTKDEELEKLEAGTLTIDEIGGWHKLVKPTASASVSYANAPTLVIPLQTTNELGTTSLRVRLIVGCEVFESTIDLRTILDLDAEDRVTRERASENENQLHPAADGSKGES